MPRPNISGGGRKSKGERELIATRAHPVLAAHVRANAEDQGLTVSDYVAVVLADALGLKQYAPAVAPSPQQELLLTA